MMPMAVQIGETFGKMEEMGGKFPETLNSTDNFGRTPLHYAATLQDKGHFFNMLLNLGADRKIEDEAGHTPQFYQENPGNLTYEDLMEDFDAPGQFAKDLLKDQEYPFFGLQGGKYLADALGGPLVRGLTEIANKRPINAVAYLTNFLHDFLEDNAEISSPIADPILKEAESETFLDEGKPLGKYEDVDSTEKNSESVDTQKNFTNNDRDEYGQSILHFAAARIHGRYGLYHLIQESRVNLGYRDELYRTARDIALEANIQDNIKEIDKYVISLAARGETEKLTELFLEGYDHILDLEDEAGDDIVSVASKQNNKTTLEFLNTVPLLEEKRERIHEAIRNDNYKLLQDICEEAHHKLAIISKNNTGRCSLHVAILCQHKDIIEFIAQRFPETLKIGDNLDRTPLHYAMGVDDVETLSKILIKCGAKRISKDIKGRQPTYYFLNKSEIFKLQEEENLIQNKL